MKSQKYRELITAMFLILGWGSVLQAADPAKPDKTVVIRDGQPVMEIVIPPAEAERMALSVKAGGDPAHSPALELQKYIARISGATLPIRTNPAGTNAGKIYVGQASDFPALGLEEEVRGLGPEGFIIRSGNNQLLLIGLEGLGTQHAVQTFLHLLGCRWFFPGEVWEVIPEQKTIAGTWNEKQSPSYKIQREMWYGFGAFSKNAQDLKEWNRHNRMGGPLSVTTSHSWIGLNKEEDFASHPDWFAEYRGKRQPSKPCYSHPEVIQRAISTGLKQAAAGAKSISVSAPDGLKYCECARCHAVAQGGEVFYDQHAQYAKRPDGQLVNITSETIFHMANKVAEAVAPKYPDVWIGCLAYSSYAHPPSFNLHPRVFVQVTTAYRRTPLSGEEQLDVFKKRGMQAGGVYTYFSVFQWDWDYPNVKKGDLSLPRLVNDLRFFHSKNIFALRAESSNNWGPRGLGYYTAARLMWDIEADPREFIADFYRHAFGPAAKAMENYYARWLGSYVRVLDNARSPVEETQAAAAKSPIGSELGDHYATPEEFTRENLKAAYKDLDMAAQQVKDMPGYRERVDHLRMYAHYLYLRIKLDEADNRNLLLQKDKPAIVKAIEEETVFASRLTDSNLIHSRASVALAFERRFKKYQALLADRPEGQGKAGSGKGFRALRQDIPTHEELEKLWAQDKAELGI